MKGLNEAQTLVLRGLLNGQKVTAANCLQFLTTRTSNEILALRKKGLVIHNENIKTSKRKFYVNYVLSQDATNIQKAITLLNIAKNKGANQCNKLIK